MQPERTLNKMDNPINQQMHEKKYKKSRLNANSSTANIKKT